MNGNDRYSPPALPGGRYAWNSAQIAVLRERRGWTQEKLAEQSGLSVRTIRNLELGVVQNPRRSSVDLLAHALGVAVEEERTYHQATEFPDRAPWRGPQPSAPPVVGDRARHAEFAHTVRANRWTTFLGPGGIGKTRLALSVAAEIGPYFRDGVAVVELGDLAPECRSPDSYPAVLQRVRRQLRCGRVPGATDAAAGGEDDLHLLLVLDNAEHVPAAATAVTRELLGTYPGLHVLVTARRRLTERLGVNREIPPLPAAAAPGEPLAQAPAVQLVLRHVAAGTHAVAEPGRNIPLVAELCRRLSGLPRYLEFAAERLRTVPVHRLLACGPTAEMLWSNDHALLAHQRSAVQSIRWDLGLLTPEHDRLLRRIAQLGGGGFVLDEVATGYDRTAPVEANPLALLSDLHEASLILADPQDRYRYRLAPFVAETLDRTLPGGGELDRWPSALAS